MKKDLLIKAVDKNDQVRVIIARTTKLVDETCRRHNTSATAAAALGRVITAALLMASDLKGEKDKLTIRIDGNGIAGPIIATADADGTARALITNPQSDVPSLTPGKLAVGELVGRDGFIEVIKDLGMKQPFVGKVELVSGEIAEDIANYYLKSEQVPSLIALGVMVAPDLEVISAGGLLIQAMPGADDKVLEQLEKNVVETGSISKALEKAPRLETVLEGVMAGMEFTVLSEQELFFKCTCSFERLKGILSSLSMDELREMTDDHNRIEVVCNFCNEVYYYSLKDFKINKNASDY